MTHVVFRLQRRLRICVIVVLAFQSTAATASAFDTFSEQTKLVDQQILAAGEISLMQRTGTQSGTHFSLGLSRPKLYQLGRYCFVSSDNLENKAGLLLVNASSTVSVATIASEISGLMVQVSEVTNVDCNAIRQQDTQQALDQIDLQRKQFELLMESLKKQQKKLRSN